MPQAIRTLMKARGHAYLHSPPYRYPSSPCPTAISAKISADEASEGEALCGVKYTAITSALGAQILKPELMP
jgi:hypothetical protein